MNESRRVRIDVLNLVLTYEVTIGHLKWKVSDVARRLNLSRSLIYYHFGKSKKEILESCYQVVAEEFYGMNLDLSPLRNLDGRGLESALIRTQSIYLKNPAIVIFYHRWRNGASGSKARIVQIEKQFQGRLRTVFPELSELDILALHTIIHGVVTSPFTSLEALRVVTNIMQTFVSERLKKIDTAGEITSNDNVKSGS